MDKEEAGRSVPAEQLRGDIAHESREHTVSLALPTVNV
jgi:hypothetical protein